MSEMSQRIAMKVLARRTDETEGDHYLRVVAWLNGDDVRTKTDLRDWTGSMPFHLNREPQ
jgi:hypothetical protein